MPQPAPRPRDEQAPSTKDSAPAALDAKLREFLAPLGELESLLATPCGVTRTGRAIPAFVSADDFDPASKKTRILLVAGFADDQDALTATAAREALVWFAKSDDAAEFRKHFALSIVPFANPDGWLGGTGPRNSVEGVPGTAFPWAASAYDSPTVPEAAYLWRWIGMHAPDLVVVIEALPVEARAKTARPVWRFPLADGGTANWPTLSAKLPEPHETLAEGTDLASQLPRSVPCGTGRIPAVQVALPRPDSDFLADLLKTLDGEERLGPSAARRALQQRHARSWRDTAEQLAKVYGHDLSAVQYIPAVALIGRLRLGTLLRQTEPLADVQKIVAPYVNGTKKSLSASPSGSDFSGHLVFGELARATSDPRYVERVRAAADFGFDAEGRPKPAMPAHSEMSDAVFMACPILAQAGRLTGEAKYAEMAVRHLRFMLKLNLRKDGLHRHSPLDETAWGRGNGFPALGLAWTLDELPDDHPLRPEVLGAVRAHLAALAPHQDPAGMWHQVIDRPESYRELTATCMIGYAMLRGVRRGWLDRGTYEPAIRRAGAAVRLRIAPDGSLVDVCTGTGKQNSLRAYYDRPAILGKDPRGGAMSLLFATELAAWEAPA